VFLIVVIPESARTQRIWNMFTSKSGELTLEAY